MLKRLQHKYALSEKGARDMVRAIVSVILSNTALMLPMVLLYVLMTDLFNDNFGSHRLPFYIVGTIISLVFIGITTYIQYNATYTATFIESGVRRTTLAEKLRKMPLSFFGKKDLSDLTTTIMSDCAALEMASSHWYPELIGSMISTAIAAVVLFAFNSKMACAVLWVLPVAFAIVIGSSGLHKRLGRRQIGKSLECAEGIQECLETVRELRAYNARESYMEGLERKIRGVEKGALVTEVGLAFIVTAAQMVLKVGIATVALVGGMLLISGELEMLEYFVFLIFVSRIYDPLQMALQNLAAINATTIQCERMDEILSHEIQTGSETLTNNGFDIEFRNVAFSYNKNENILNDVSFTARQGEVTALIGPSGGGKTTISRLAARFWDITRGRITVGGMDISEIDPETLMSLYSIVFQDVTLFNNTIMENIRIGRKDASDEEVITAAKAAHCDEFVCKLEKSYDTMIGENGCELSGGERQRLSIARAFLKDAPIILLDEATASLDVDNETMIQESLSKLIKNKTVLIIAHRMRTIANADKVVVLKDGIVAEQGTPYELAKQNGIYKHMTDMQLKAVEWKM